MQYCTARLWQTPFHRLVNDVAELMTCADCFCRITANKARVFVKLLPCKQHEVMLEVELKLTCFHFLSARSEQSGI